MSSISILLVEAADVDAGRILTALSEGGVDCQVLRAATRVRHDGASSSRTLGVGLFLVRHLVEAHSGSVEADSPGEGCGAIFTVRLPARAETFAARAHSA